MFLCYLIDPDSRSITKVNDGFDRAAELTGSEHPGLAELWTDFAGSTLDVAYSPDADEQPSFRVRLSFRGKTIEQAISGKGVLIACGEIPLEIAQQIQTAEAVKKMVEFSHAGYIAVDRWLEGWFQRDACAGSTRGVERSFGLAGRPGQSIWQAMTIADGDDGIPINVLILHGPGDRDMRVITSDNRLWPTSAASH